MRTIGVWVAAAGLLALPACGTGANSLASPGASAASSSPTAQLLTKGQLIATAQRVYPKVVGQQSGYTYIGVCGTGTNGKLPQTFSGCPFAGTLTGQLQTFLNANPNFGASLLCHCQMYPNSATYDATSTSTGGIATVKAMFGDANYVVFKLSIGSDSLVTAISISNSNGCTEAIAQTSCEAGP